MKRTILSTAILCLFSANYNAQTPGTLDLTFGNSGYALTDQVTNTGEIYYDLLTLSDDKIIKVGSTSTLNNRDVIVAKFLTDGTPDLSFGVNGLLRIDMSIGQDEQARGVVELSDGKLLITGYVDVGAGYDAFIMRLNANGTVDNSFGLSSGHTKFNTGDDVTAVGRSISIVGNEIYVAGQVNVAGQWDGMLVNFTQGGGIDVSFSSSGFATFDVGGTSDYIREMAINSANEFFIGGSSVTAMGQEGFVVKLSQFGTPTTFAGSGTYTFDAGSGSTTLDDLIIDLNNKVVATGYDGTLPNIDGYVMRINSDGTKDLTFGTAGVVITDPGATTSLYLNSIVETPNGGLISAGSMVGVNNEIYALFLNADGSYNTSYGGNGDVNIPFTISTNSINTKGVDLQSDGSIIIGGQLTSQDFIGENMFMVRLYPSVLSISETHLNTVVVYPNPILSQFSLSMDNVNAITLISLDGKALHFWGKEDLYLIPDYIVPGVYLLKISSKNSFQVKRVHIK